MSLTKPEVISLLHRVEKDHNIVVLFAAETGSIAQGLDGPNSDNDIKFIYVRPTRSYLGLGARDDVIENPYKAQHPNIDFTGWDVQKALNLAFKSNPGLVEWLSHTEHVYHELPVFTEPLREILLSSFVPRVVMYHHYGLAKKTWMELSTDEPVKSVKALTMLVRSLLIVQVFHGRVYQTTRKTPPWTFEALLDMTTAKKHPIYPFYLDIYRKRRQGDDRITISSDVASILSAEMDFAKNVTESYPVGDTKPNILQLEKLCLQMTLDSGRLF